MLTNSKRLWPGLFLLWLLSGLSLTGLGQSVTTIVNNGDPANRLDMVILAEGYTAAEQTKFATDVQNLIPNFFAQEPYKEYQNYFNVHRIDVVSAESGADHPPLLKNTAFDATYSCNGIQRLICVNTTKVNTVLTSLLGAAQRDMILVLVNDTEYGGSGGSIAVASIHSAVVELVLHESGHSFGLLADEYGGPPPPNCNASVEPPEVNATKQTVRNLIKWTAWIDAGTPLPTTTTTAGIPGLYAGAKYCDADLYRPTNNSKMKTLGTPFEQINSEQLIKRIYNLATPLDSSLPLAGSFTVPQGTTQQFSVVTPLPLTHALSINWLVDGVSQALGATFNWNVAAAGPGLHTVDVLVKDTTTMVRNDPTMLLQETRRWNVTVTGALALSTVTPAAGRMTGMQQIKLAGAFANLASVTIGGNTATWSYTNGAGDTSMVTVTTPTHAAGAVNIVLTPSAGSTFTKTNAFAYLPTIFTDDTLVAGVTTAKAQHLIELRQAVDALRAVAGLTIASWTDSTLVPGGTVIKAVHITELRSNLEAAVLALGYGTAAYTDPMLNGLPIKRAHIEELRQRIRAIAG